MKNQKANYNNLYTFHTYKQLFLYKNIFASGLKMENENEIEKSFMEKISLIKLKFKDSQVENEYAEYRKYEKHVPAWTAWLIASLVILLVGRKIQVLVLLYASDSSTYGRIDVELITIAIVLAAGLLEIITFYWKKITIIRGIPLSVALFFTVSYSAQVYFPAKIILPTT